MSRRRVLAESDPEYAIVFREAKRVHQRLKPFWNALNRRRADLIGLMMDTKATRKELAELKGLQEIASIYTYHWHVQGMAHLETLSREIAARHAQTAKETT